MAFLFGPGMRKVLKARRERREKLLALWQRSVSQGATLLKQPKFSGEQLMAVLAKFNIGAFRAPIAGGGG